MKRAEAEPSSPRLRDYMTVAQAAAGLVQGRGDDFYHLRHGFFPLIRNQRRRRADDDIVASAGIVISVARRRVSLLTSRKSWLILEIQATDVSGRLTRNTLAA